MNLEDHLSKYVILPGKKLWVHKFVLANLKGENYLCVGNHFELEEHSNVLERLIRSKDLSFEKQSKALEGDGYKVLSMGMCNVDVKKMRANFYGQSIQYHIGVTKEGMKIIKNLLPNWAINYYT